jgi:2-amino-4-hydroxy-6-hydroxymethyldihydropteridine diphosphokinase
VTLAYVGLGSNLDDPVRQVLQAFDELDGLPRTRVVKRSSLFRTAPVGHAAQPDYVNAVARLETGLPAERLLDELQRIEAAHGRRRSFPNAPRTLDLDLLLFGELQLSSERLRVPHPRLHERAFVLEPLVELDPELVIPGLGPARDWRAGTRGQGVQRLAP